MALSNHHCLRLVTLCVFACFGVLLPECVPHESTCICAAGNTLYRRVAELVPKHPGRSKKAQAAVQAAKEKEEREARAAAGAASGKSGKKGKKGRK